jgi:hypothetical protein
VAFPLAARDPAAVAETIGQALRDKQARDERPVAFGSEYGSPQKVSSERFAGDIFGGNLGISGAFGGATNDKKNKEVQDKLGLWAQQWASGPFGPDMGAPV